MQLVYFLFLPSALLSKELLSYSAVRSLPSEADIGSVDLGALLNMWMVVGCFALAARWLEQSQHTVRPKQTVWILHNRDSLLLWLWCLLQPICLVASGWTQWTHRITSSPGLQSLGILLSLTPCILLLLLVDLIRISRLAQRHLTRNSLGSTVAHYQSELTWRIVNTWFIPMALPIVIAAMVDIASRIHIVEPNQGIFGTALCTVATSTLVTLLLPHLFVRLIGAEPVDETVHAVVEKIWRLSNVPIPRILLWPTGCRMSNAAVVGVFAFGRKLLLTDALLQRLNDRELTMVVLHELAHCVRFHAWIRILPTLIVVLLLFIAMTVLSGIGLGIACAVLFLLFVVSLVGVCWWTELDADRFALKMAVRFDADSKSPALVQSHASDLSEALTKIVGNRNMRRRSWMHPSCAQRLSAIQSYAQLATRGGNRISP